MRARFPMRMTRIIERWDWAWFGLIGLMLCFCFNGQWLIGPDSAAYRQLGHKLATTGRYVFRDKVPGVPVYNDEQTSRYPGLPILLAAVEKTCGAGDLPPLLFMQAITILTLLLTYRLMLYHVDRWLAICVVVGMGTNVRFLQYSNELLTDMPFLLGVAMTMLGYERLMRAKRGWPAAGSLGLAFAGLVLAATMRPTFWFLAVALVAACAWGFWRGRAGMGWFGALLLELIFAGLVLIAILGPAVGFLATALLGVCAWGIRLRFFPPRIIPEPQTSTRIRWRFALLLAALAVAGGVFLLVLDLRSKTGLLSGGYEMRMHSMLLQFKPKLVTQLHHNLEEMLGTALPISFYGSRLGKFGIYNSVLIVACGIWLSRRSILWGLLVLATVLALSIWGAIPRYFMMLLPLLLAGWGVVVHAIAVRLRGKWAPDLVLVAGLGVVLVVNLVICLDFIRIQRGITRPVSQTTHKWVGFHHVGFLNVYHNGQWAGVRELAASVASHTSPRQKLIGPEATVLTFLSGRQVYPAVTAVPYHGQEVLIELGLFPVRRERGAKFVEYDTALGELLDAGQLSPGKQIAGPVDGYWLAEMNVSAWSPRPGRQKRLDDEELNAYARRRAHPSRALRRYRAMSDAPATAPTSAPAGP